MSPSARVLVADDEPRITKLVSLALGEEGFRVITAGGGEEALRKAEEYRPDVVLLDIVMPDLDGIEVMRQLRTSRPIPVILLTAKGSTADKAKGLDLGADDYVAKPFHPDELAARATGRAHDLADALMRLDRASELVEFAASPATEPLYPVDPFESEGVARMFKTHPPLEERIRRLRELGAGANGRVASVDELAG